MMYLLLTHHVPRTLLGLGGKQNRHVKIILSDGKGAFSFSSRARQAERSVSTSTQKLRSPLWCLSSVKRGSRTHKELARKRVGERECALHQCPESEGCESGSAVTRNRSLRTTRQALGTGQTRRNEAGWGEAGRGREARDPRRARGCMDRRGLSGPCSRGLYDTALARGTGRGWLRGRRLLHAVHLAVTLALNSREK